MVGADEFVLDSYKIREGKFSILEMEGKSFESLSANLLDEYPDTLIDGDVLTIIVYHPSRVDLVQAIGGISSTLGFPVSGGVVRLPDLEPIKVEGKTLDEAREAIQDAYAKQISNLEVFLSYKNRQVRKVELAGLVSTPNIPVNGKMRLFDVMAQARVPTNANFFKSYVIRDNEYLPVDINRLMTLGDMSQNIVMRGGDKIYIADTGASSLMVLGEVAGPGVIPLPTGTMPLRHVLAAAGGLLGSGDRSYIQILRGSITQPKIYTVNWQHVVRLPTDSLLVIPGDIVYVAATPVAEWNRFVNAMLPTITAYELFNKHVKGVILP
ncbi:MAG: hypothetical protein SP1CHLAM54_13500 [Chlamydiia bacterium]|nr:hypothetical protein [Chlamydiia bacterium]MCH9616243.1 hypothetical protein [Chlamydiia bacterium]MCH9629771.1 hypothetical protein [Chlamydiia bacterium]